MITYSKKLKGYRCWLGQESVWQELVQSDETARLIEEFRRTGDRETKLKLPVVNFQGYDPAVLKDGGVGKRIKNSKLWYHPTGLFMVDIDHVDDPTALFGKLPQCLSDAGVDFASSVALVHVTSSGKGLRIVMKGRAGSTVASDQKWLAALLGVEGDPHVVDYARWSFVPKESDILLQNSALLFAEPFTDIYPKTTANKYAVETFEEQEVDRSAEIAAYHELCDHINAGKFWKNGKDIKLTEIDAREFLGELFGRAESVCPFEDTLSDEYVAWLKKYQARQSLIQQYKSEGKDPKTVPPIDYTGQTVWDYNPIFFSQYRNKEGKIVNENMVGHGKPINNDVMMWILSRPTFCTVRPVTYVGHQALNKYARYCYAMPFDVDKTDVKKFDQLLNLIGMGLAPKPNLIVASGHGLHVYYLLKKPIYCGSSGGRHQTLMNRFRAGFLPVVANPVTCGKVNKDGVCSPDDLPFGQGYRMPGTRTHFKETVRVWRVEDSPLHSITELNVYIKKTSRSALQLSPEECKSLDSSWYNSEVFPKYDDKKKSKRKKRTDTPRYNKWLFKLHEDKSLCAGHRYNCIAILAYRARIDYVPFERLKNDAYGMLDYLDSLTIEEGNHFTQQDMDAALKVYHSNARYSNTMEILKSGLYPSPKEKAIQHNGRTVEDHLRRQRLLQNADDPEGKWRNKEGRPVATPQNSKEYAAVQQWRRENPENTNKSQCARDCGMTRKTVAKWWSGKQDESVLKKGGQVQDLIVDATKLFAPGSDYTIDGYTHDELIEIVTNGEWQERGIELVIG